MAAGGGPEHIIHAAREHQVQAGGAGDDEANGKSREEQGQD